MASLKKVQPFKGIYLLSEGLITIFLRLPVWVLLALPRSNRPRKSWTFKRALMLRFFKYLYPTYGMFKEPSYLALEQGPKIKGVWMPAVPHLITGDLKRWAAISNVESIRIPGYWIEDDKGLDLPIGAPPQPDEKVLLNIHGGAFACQSAHPDNLVANIPRGILQHTGPRVSRALAVEYRLSKARTESPSNAFPAALLDVVCAYNYLVNEVGFAPQNIIAVGDSAGGSLAIALTRYLLENQGAEGIPQPPGALILNSPWVDLGPSPTDPSSSVYTNIHSDFIAAASSGTEGAIANYLGPHGLAAAITNPYISPASLAPTMPHVSFKGFPRSFILNSGAEVLCDQIRVLRDKMRADIGENVEYAEFPDAWHDFLVFVDVEPERTEALELIGKWIG
ncbi:alpha/beta-hydrolase [Cytidiella melzeri]|nr:alpha/beta-hydrolase [Cytidiella melzeri]